MLSDTITVRLTIPAEWQLWSEHNPQKPPGIAVVRGEEILKEIDGAKAYKRHIGAVTFVFDEELRGEEVFVRVRNPGVLPFQHICFLDDLELEVQPVRDQVFDEEPFEVQFTVTGLTNEDRVTVVEDKDVKTRILEDVGAYERRSFNRGS